MAHAHLHHALIAGDAATDDGPLGAIVHGILGSGRNWASFARRWTAARPTWRVALVDLRNHGESESGPPPHSVEACADDLGGLFANLREEPAVLLGHSYGGKVAVSYAERLASELRSLFVLDSPPGPARAGGGPDEVREVIAALAEVPVPVESRRALITALTARGFSDTLARWMTTNLERTEGGFGWRFVLEAMPQMLESYAALDLWRVLESPPSGVRVEVVRGGRSSRWSPDDIARLGALADGGRIGHHVLDEAGHWLHADDPDGLWRVVDAALSARE